MTSASEYSEMGIGKSALHSVSSGHSAMTSSTTEEKDETAQQIYDKYGHMDIVKLIGQYLDNKSDDENDHEHDINAAVHLAAINGHKLICKKACHPKWPTCSVCQLPVDKIRSLIFEKMNLPTFKVSDDLQEKEPETENKMHLHDFFYNAKGDTLIRFKKEAICDRLV